MSMVTEKTAWKTEELTVNGFKVQMMVAGQGEPLMFWHGAGTIGGWDFALPWAEKFKVYLPYHLGWGGSADDASMTSMQDYVMHYLDLLDQLKLDKFRLVGLSMGGWMAATFASQHAHRLKKLVLVAPAGLRDKAHPIADIFKIKPENLLPSLVENINVLVPFLPKDPNDVDFIVGAYREQTSLARIAWERSYDPKLPKYLHRINVPTLLVWGKQDKIIPAAQAATWQKLIPGAQVKLFEPAGHLVLNEKPESVRAIGEFLA